MSNARTEAARRWRLRQSLDRLAALIEDGELLAAGDPSDLINATCDEIERLRKLTGTGDDAHLGA
jgi:hypothetical protein